MERPKGLRTPQMRFEYKDPELVLPEDTIEGFRQTYPDVEWIDHDLSSLRKADGSVDIIELADFYLELVKKHHIQIILGCTSDVNTVICSYLAHHCPWLKLNSLETDLLSNSKYFTRKLLVPDEYNLKYHLISLDSPEDVVEAIKVVGFPMIIKPTLGTGSMMIKKCANEQELHEYLEVYREEERLGTVSSYYKQYGKLLLGLEEKYPHLKTSNVLAEGFVDEQLSPCTSIEYLVQNGKVMELTVVDNVYWPSNPGSLVGCCFPTSLHNEASLKSARDMCKQMVQRLIANGFDNSMGNVEYFVFADGTTRVMENNSRTFAQFNESTKTLLHNGDMLRILIDLQKGTPVAPPKYKFLDDDSAPKFVFNFYVNTMESGLASELFNYTYAEQLQREGAPGLTKCQVLIPKERRVTCISDSGIPFAWCFMYGDSFTDCLLKFKPIFHKLILNSENGSIWEDKILEGLKHPSAK